MNKYTDGQFTIYVSSTLQGLNLYFDMMDAIENVCANAQMLYTDTNNTELGKRKEKSGEK